MVTRLMFVSEAPSRIGWIHYALLILPGQRCGQVNLGGPWGHMDFALPMWMCIPLLIAGLFDLEQRHGAAAARSGSGNRQQLGYNIFFFGSLECKCMVCCYFDHRPRVRLLNGQLNIHWLMHFAGAC